MSCILAICLSLSGVYIDGSVSALDTGIEIYEHERTLITREGLDGNVHYLGDSWRHARSRESLNPYGRLAVGYEQPFFVPQLRLSAELYHESSLATGRDRGVNGARVGLRWYPWGGASR